MNSIEIIAPKYKSESTVLPGNCQCEACNSINCNSVRRMAGAESLAFKKASRIIETSELKKRKVYVCLAKWKVSFQFTSDKDLTGGFTQSSQHLESKVSSTRGGGAPSHCVRNCNCRRFNWQNISVRNAINAMSFVGVDLVLATNGYTMQYDEVFGMKREEKEMNATYGPMAVYVNTIVKPIAKFLLKIRSNRRVLQTNLKRKTTKNYDNLGRMDPAWHPWL
uniref:Uncharacterized protein n=1 Tax=Glossina pallidipes TaxID=7398 RepID=A0A1B0A4U4_GLOPL